ncbi:MAG: acyltransferase family protein [Halobacteriota archaeon]|jgi:glucans biosynthesis protein C
MPRLYYFDNIKILLIVIVVFIHAGLAYIPTAEGWSPSFPGTLPFADVLVVGTFEAVAASFAMALFFFISAYLLVGSFDRKGRQKFLRDRFVRIGIPLFGIVAFYLILIAAVGANPATYSLGNLWFLVFLLILAVAYSVWWRFNIRVGPVPCPGSRALLLAALVLGAASFVVRVWYAWDQWLLWHAVEPAHVPLYVLFMIGGILAYRNGWLETISPSLVKTWGIITVVGLCCIPVFIVVIGVTSVGGGFTLAALLYAFWEAFLGIGICTCLLIVFKHRWNTTGRIKAALARNVYTVYLIQIPIILYLQGRFIQGGVLIPGGLPALLQFVLVGAIATVFCFLFSNYIVRKIPYMDRVIF